MKRIVVGVLLAMALVVSAGSAGATGTTTSCGMAYIPPFPAVYYSSTERCSGIVCVSNITDDYVHVKITLYYETGVVERTWEADVAPHATYSQWYDASDHPSQSPMPRYYGTIEWTASFCTQKALIANAHTSYVATGSYYRAQAEHTMPINGGLPF